MSKEKIIKQVEYYFGDINLPRDKFLLENQKLDDGWVTLETMLKFNRLAQITTKPEEIAEALRDSSLLEVSEDNTKVRRRLEFPLPDNNLEYWQEIKSRTIYVKGFNEDTTLDDIQTFLEPYGAIKNVIMRRTKGAHIFKGSIFVTFKDKEEAKAFLENNELTKYKENELIKIFQEAYWANKQKQLKEKRKAEQKLKKTQKNLEDEDQKSRIVQTTFIKGVLLKITGLPTKFKVEIIKDFFRKYGDPAYVTVTEDSATIRFNSDTENIAKEVWEKAIKASEDGRVILTYEDKEYPLEAVVLEDEDEKNYWLDFQKSKIARIENLQNNKNNRKGNKKSNHKHKNNRKRGTEEENEEMTMKKSKHIKFSNDENEKELSENNVTKNANKNSTYMENNGKESEALQT